MRCYRSAGLIALVGVSLAGAPAVAQQTGGRMGGGMMGMGHDSATAAQMIVIHELVVNHDRIERTVTNLPDGIRTITESDDPRLAQLIQQHVASMIGRVRHGDDPGLPMSSAAAHAIFQNHERIRTTTRATATGIVVEQTSSDSLVVAALQQHAAEVNDLVEGGMAAMHAAMMKNGGGMMQHMRADTTADEHGRHAGHAGQVDTTVAGQTGQVDTTAAGHAGHAKQSEPEAHAGHAGHADSAFAELQERGRSAMGVDQYTSTHQFDALPDGGRIELQRDVDDSAGVAQIRRHLQEIARAFASGDFSTPGVVHAQEVPGTSVMAARRAAITYTYRELPRGGEVRILTRDPDAVAAIHEFLAFQRQDHRVP